MAHRTIVVSTPIPTGASRAAVMAGARHAQAELGLDPLADRPERALARALGVVHRRGKGSLLGRRVELLSAGEGTPFEFWPSWATSASEDLDNWSLGILCGHALLHRGAVTAAHGPDAAMVVEFGAASGEGDAERRAFHEACWFMTELCLPAERVERDVRLLGYDRARRHCGVRAATFDHAIRFHGLGRLAPEAA